MTTKERYNAHVKHEWTLKVSQPALKLSPQEWASAVFTKQRSFDLGKQMAREAMENAQKQERMRNWGV